MNRETFLVGICLFGVGVGAGVWIGKGRTPAAAVRPGETTVLRRPASNALPVVKVNRQSVSPEVASSPLKPNGNKLSYDEAVAGLKAAARESQNKRFESIRDVIRMVDPAAVPRLLQDLDSL